MCYDFVLEKYWWLSNLSIESLDPWLLITHIHAARKVKVQVNLRDNLCGKGFWLRQRQGHLNMWEGDTFAAIVEALKEDIKDRMEKCLLSLQHIKIIGMRFGGLVLQSRQFNIL